MADITNLTRPHDGSGTRAGFKVTTHAGGDRFVTTLRYTSDDHDTVTATNRVAYRDEGGTDQLEAKATEAVRDAMADRGLEVAQ